MTADFPTLVAPAPVRSRKHLTVASLLAFVALGLMAAFPQRGTNPVARQSRFHGFSGTDI